MLMILDCSFQQDVYRSFCIYSPFSSSPESIDRSNITERLSASCSAHSFSILLSMLSGPEAFGGLTLDKCCCTPSVLILIGFMVFLVFFFTDGRGSDDSFEKTDWNCLTSTLYFCFSFAVAHHLSA